jgi:hypothetical protein
MRDKVQVHDDVHDGSSSRYHCTPVRHVLYLVRSRYLAAAAIAFCVSLSFHWVDNKSTQRIAQQNKVIICTIREVADQQKSFGHADVRLSFRQCSRELKDQ